MITNHAQKRLGPDVIGCDLGLKIAFALLWRADGREQSGQRAVLLLTGAIEISRLDANAFLVNMPAERHRAGRRAADVGVMCAVGDVADELIVREDWGHE